MKKGNVLPFPKNEKIGLNNNNSILTERYGFVLGNIYNDMFLNNKIDDNYLSKFENDPLYKDFNNMLLLNEADFDFNKKDKFTGIQTMRNVISDIYEIKNISDIPDIIWKSNDDFIIGFIDGVFSSEKSKKIELTNKNKQFLDSISSLLSFYGIKSKVFKNETPSYSNLVTNQYNLNLSNHNIVLFNNIFHISNSDKKEYLLKIIKEQKNFDIDNHKSEIKIKSVIETRLFEDVWDIQVFDETHTFYINDCVTGNCGEQILPIGGVCLLGNLDLTQFINEDFTNWDYEKLGKVIPVAIRFMDNVNDLTYVPLEDQKTNLVSKRRIGLGVMGYGSALLMMKKRYGGDEALKMTDELMNFIANTAYQSSAFLAKEKGSFLLYDEEKYLQSKYIMNLSDETKAIIKQNGMRNSHLLSVQPTGNSSILANVVSGGLEPVFLFDYIRTVIQPFAPEGLSVPKNIDWSSLTFTQDGNQDWNWVKEGDDNMLKTVFNDQVYKYDNSRGLLKESIVKDYGVNILEKRNEWNPDAEWAANIGNLKIDEHVKTMHVISKYIDSSMSKTINLPNDYKYEDFKNVYIDLYNSGTIKGGTTYRAGTMSTVIKKKEDSSDAPVSAVIPDENNAPKRPKNIECDVHRFTNKGEKWIGFIGLMDGYPYEVFTGLLESFVIPTWVERGFIRKEKIKKDDSFYSRYDFVYYDKENYEVIMTGLNRAFEREYWNIGKMTSALLRHHIHLPSVINIIESLKLDGDVMGTWKKGMTRMLKKYVKTSNVVISSDDVCPSCGSHKLVYQENCIKCLDCMWSKCM